MKGNGLVQCFFPWTAERFYNQVLAFSKKLGLPLANIVCVLSIDQAFCES